MEARYTRGILITQFRSQGATLSQNVTRGKILTFTCTVGLAYNNVATDPKAVAMAFISTGIAMASPRASAVIFTAVLSSIVVIIPTKPVSQLDDAFHKQAHLACILHSPVREDIQTSPSAILITLSMILTMVATPTVVILLTVVVHS